MPRANCGISHWQTTLSQTQKHCCKRSAAFLSRIFSHCPPPAADAAVQAIVDANRAFTLLAALKREEVPTEIIADPDAFMGDNTLSCSDSEAFHKGG